MKSLKSLKNVPSSVPLVADDVTELHAARVLLLLRLCGTANRIKGLTKLAKLDFFVRYPAFFERVSAHLQAEIESAGSGVESPMVRHHYGPWDKRYYHVLPFLEARNLLAVSKENSSYVFRLTESGKKLATELSKLPEFAIQAQQMKKVKVLLGRKTGTALKKLVYEIFDSEVRIKKFGEVIR
jgi:DNA-binding PadR family transcriptional regulator